MTDSPDAIRADIERTRAELGSDVDALADKVTPSKIVERQTDRLKGAVGSVRDRVFGAADDTGHAASRAASDVADSAADVARRARSTATGSPVAVGLIAFGAGLLAASLIPASQREKGLADQAKQKAQPLVDEVAGVAKEAASNLKEPAQEAAAAVKDRAQEAVETVTSDTEDAASTVGDRAKDAQQTVSES